MRTRRRVLELMCAAACAALALGATFTWTDADGDHYWDNCDNWTKVGISQTCYPSSTNDDVQFPASDTAYTVKLITEYIDDLTIMNAVGVSFLAKEGTPTLTLDQFVIDSPTDAELVITISGATISTGGT